jgi:hypothetical protein
MQRRKIRKPARPPRRSRKAKRRVGARLGRGTSPVAGAFKATPFSLGEKVAGEARQMRAPHQSRRRALRPNPHPQPLSRWRGERTAHVFRLEKVAAISFSPGEKVAGEARRMRESRQRRQRALRANPHPRPLSRWRGESAADSMCSLKPPPCSCRKRRRRNPLILDPARAHADHPVAARSERGVMRDERQGRSAPRG